MSIFTTRPALRWLVPAAVAATVIGGGAAVRTLTADASPSLGIPALPTAGGQGSCDLSSLVSGSHTLRVWYAGPDSARIALLGTLGESDVIRVGRDVWTWTSSSNTATHRVLPTEQGHERPPLDPQALPKTPQEAADAALAAIDPTTKVTTGSAARVAGRAAYELILQPRDTASLIGQVRVAIDAQQHVPLRVQVYPAKSDATAIEVAFTQVSFARPDAAQFKFAPPPGAKVTEETGEPAPRRPTRTPRRSSPSSARAGPVSWWPGHRPTRRRAPLPRTSARTSARVRASRSTGCRP